MKRLILLPLIALLGIPAFAEESKRKVLVSVRVFAASPVQIAAWRHSLGKSVKELPDIGAQSPISGEHVRAIRKSVKLGKATLLSAPDLSVGESSRTHVMVLKPISYVKTYRLGEGDEKPQPVIATMHEGLIMGVRPVISKDAKMITVQVEYGVTTVVRPIPHVKTKAGLIHEPEVKKFKGRLTQTVASEGSFIILGFPHSGTKRPRQLAILVAARVIKAKPPGK